MLLVVVVVLFVLFCFVCLFVLVPDVSSLAVSFNICTPMPQCRSEECGVKAIVFRPRETILGPNGRKSITAMKRRIRSRA